MNINNNHTNSEQGSSNSNSNSMDIYTTTATTATTATAANSNRRNRSKSSNRSNMIAEELDRSRVLQTYHNALHHEHQELKQHHELKQHQHHQQQLKQVNDPDLNRIARMAARIFQTPHSTISLVDVTQVHFVTADTNNDDTNEVIVPRNGTFCCHVVEENTDDDDDNDEVLVVTDALQDARFRSSPCVTGPPHVRFCAGAPLLVPEGFRIGSFCVFSDQPRPQGITEDEKETLRDLAATAVRIMVDKKKYQSLHPKPFTLATASHDVMTPLTGLQLSLQLLQEEQDQQQKQQQQQQTVNTNTAQTELLATATSCTNVLTRIFRTTLDTLRGKHTSATTTTSTTSTTIATNVDNNDNGLSKEETLGASLQSVPTLVDCLDKIMAPVPKQVPLFFEIHPDTPDTLAVDDLPVFRAALNFVSAACARTQAGSIRLYIRPDQDDNDNNNNDNNNHYVLVECHDTAPSLSPHDSQHLFWNRNNHIHNNNNNNNTPQQQQEEKDLHDSALIRVRSAAALIQSVGGSWGYRPANNNNNNKQGSVMWFRVPAQVEEEEEDEDTKSAMAVVSSSEVSSVVSSSETTASVSSSEMTTSAAATTTTTTTTTTRCALVVDDSLIIRKMLTRSLRKLGYQVDVAEDGQVGLNKLKEREYDLVLLDFLMPVMDGMDCVKQFREWEAVHRQTSSTRSRRLRRRQRIVGISAHASPFDAQMGIQAGMDDFQAKPVSLDTLRQMMMLEDTAAVTSCQMIASSDADDTRKSRKRRRREEQDDDESVVVHTRHCLVLSSGEGTELQKWTLLHTMRQHGWVCRIAQSPKKVSHLLQIRNWDAVLVNNMNEGYDCLQDFRRWERQNRVHRQANVFWVSSAMAGASHVQPPQGMDDVLHPHVDYDHFSSRVQASQTVIITR